MAKKKDFKLDDFALDKDLDFKIDDFDIDMPKDDRKPATKAATGFLRGVRDSIFSGAMVRKVIKTALPEGYGNALDLADTTADSLRDLYNTSAKELKPALNDLRRATGKVLPTAEKVMPQSISKRMRKFHEDYEKPSRNSAPDPTEMAVANTLVDVFKTTTQNNADRAAEEDAQSRIRDTMDQARHRDQLGQLDAIRMGVTQLANYQDKIGSAFQRKSLEINMRHYFVSVEALRQSKQMNAMLMENLADIKKNTGLPDYVKKHPSEMLSEIMRNKFLGAATDGVFGKRNEFVRNFSENLMKQVTERVKGFASGIRSGISGAEDMMEAAGGAEEYGGSKHDMAGYMAGSAAGEYLGSKAIKKAKPFLDKHKGIGKLGHKLDYFFNPQNIAQHAKEFANGYTGDGIPGMGLIKDTINSSLGVNKTLDTDNIHNLQTPQPFNRRNSKSISEVIPGYLARILREVQILRTGDDKIPLTVYDYTSNGFGRQDDVRKKIFDKIVSQSSKKYVSEDVNKFIDKVDPDKKLSEEQRKILGEWLLNDNLKNGKASKSRMTDAFTFNSKGASKHGYEFANLFQDYFKEDEKGSAEAKQNHLQAQFRELGRPISDSRAMIQDLANSGLLEDLMAMGVISNDGVTVDSNKLYSYYYSEDYAGNYDPALPSRKQKKGHNKFSATLKSKSKTSTRNIHSSKTVNKNKIYNQVFTTQPEMAKPLDNSGPQKFSIDEDQVSSFKDFIAAQSNKPTVEEILSVLMGLREDINHGVPVFNIDGQYEGDGPSFSGDKRFRDMTMGEVGSAAKKYAKRFGKYAKGKYHSAKAKLTKHFNTAKNFAMTVGTKYLNNLKDRIHHIRDVYIKGELLPRIVKAKMQAGEYFDAKTGKVIQTYDDIKGAVVDKDGNIIITAEDVKNLFVKSTVGEKIIEFGKKIKGVAGFMLSDVRSKIPKIINALKSTALKAYSLTLDGPQDVFVKGGTEPILLAMIMRNGGYFSATSGNPIRKVSDIDGPIVNGQGEYVLTKDMIEKGLYDRNGHPLAYGLRKLGMIAKRFLDKGKAIGKNLFGMVQRGFGNIGFGFGRVFGKLFGEEGIVFAGSKKMVDTLIEIKDILDTRLPDSGGKIRKGSFEDLERKKKEKASGGSEKKDDNSDGKSSKGLLGTLTGFLKKFKKGDDEEKKDEDGNPIIDGAEQELGERAAGKGLKWGKKLLGKAKGLGRFLKFGRTAATVATAAEGAASMGAGASAAGTGMATLAAGGTAAAELGAGTALATTGAAAATGTAAAAGTAAAGGGLLAGLTGIGATIGSVLAAPVVAIPLAIAAVGAAGYFGMKYLTRRKADALGKLRMAQYGFLPDDESHHRVILEMEDKLANAVFIKDGIAAINEKKVDGPALVSSFGIDLKDNVAVGRWIRWFVERFKPVFLTHISVLNGIKPGAKLADVMSLKPAERQKYLDGAKWPGGPYEFRLSPFPDDAKTGLKAGKREVAAQVDAVIAEFKKKPEQTKMVAAGRLGLLKVTDPASSQVPGQKAQAAHAKTDPQSTAAAKQRFGPMGGAGAAGVVTGAAGAALGHGFGSKLDAIAAIRYKTYGLRDMDVEKVTALANLENYINAGIKFNSDKVATWGEGAEAALKKMGPSFGTDLSNKGESANWVYWFTKRFLPTYMNYVTALFAATAKTDPKAAYAGLKPGGMLNVAIACYGSTTSRGKGSDSVWLVSASPWPGYSLNADIKSIDPNVQGLKDSTKQGKLGQETAANALDAKGNKKTAAGEAAAAAGNGKAGGGFFDTLKSSVSNFGNMANGALTSLSTGISDTVHGAVDSVKTALGIEVDQPGNGTGGDINKIPKPAGNKSYQALKPTIDAAAAMAGVDPKLMATMAAIESGFDASVKAKGSSATGLYQFIGDTWKTMLKRYGGKYGINPNTPPTDARASALMGAEYIKENLSYLKKVKNPLTDVDAYLAHFLGAGGAAKLLKGDTNASAPASMPAQARANPSIFYENGRPRTFGEVYQEVARRVRAQGSKFGLGGGGAVAAPTASKAAPAAKSVAPSAPAKASPAAPATTKPVAKPAPAAAASKTAAKASAPPPAPQRAQASPVAPKVDAVSTGVPRSSGEVHQQAAAVKHAEQANIGAVGGILKESLGIQKSQLEVLRQILTAVGNGSVQSAPKPTASKASRTMPTPPLTFAKPSYEN